MDERDFFEAILDAAHEDDGPTLIYADWLEERGELVRPNYIRTEVAFARVDQDDPEVSEQVFELRRHRQERYFEYLQSEEGKLPELTGATWFFPVRGLNRWLWVEDEVACELASGAPWRWAPIEYLTFLDCQALPQELANFPAMARARSIEWNYDNEKRGPKADFTDHLTAPPLSRLISLTLNSGSSRPRPFALRPDDALPRLSGLKLEGHRLSAETATDLLTGRLFPGLTSLTLESCRISGEDQGAWARGLVLPQLESVHFGQVRGASSPWFSELGTWTAPKLESFDASGLRLNVQTFHEMIEWPLLKGPRSLSLTGSRIGLPGARALAGASGWEGLRYLDLSNNAIDDAALKALLKGRALEGLTRLDLARNPIGDAGALALADSPLLEGLLELNLSHTQVGKEGGLALARALPRTRLRRLDFGGAPASNDLQALGEGEVPGFDRLVLGWGLGIIF